MNNGDNEKKKLIMFALPDINHEEINEVIDTLKSGWLTTGPKVRKFEEEFAEFIGSKYALAVNSCTGGLHLSLAAAGVGEGDEVITTPFTFVSTVNVILHLGAKPVFVDIGPDFNIDVNKIEAAITPKTKVILPVHYSGQPCEMDAIMDLAKKYNLTVIEDAAHAVGAEYKGKKIGTIGDLTAFSFYATKNLTTGEGGMVTTNNEEYAQKIRKLTLHGISKDAWKRYTSEGSWYYEVIYAGYKYNMTDIQAAIGLHQLKKIEKFNSKRAELAQLYTQLLSDVEEIETPKVNPEVKHSWHLYVIKLNLEMLKIGRSEFIEKLKENGIMTSVHFIPVHLHPYYRETFGFKKGDFPVAEAIYERVISLPLHTKLEKNAIYYIAEVIKNLCKKYRR